MKQYITVEQLEECENPRRLMDWMTSHNYGLLPNIGQMIEFLDENYRKENLFVWAIDRSKDKWELYSQEHESVELCDALWEAVKEVLEG